MGGFLINGEFLIMKDGTYKGTGKRNVDKLLDSLECILSTVERPYDSICWLEYQNDMLDGVKPCNDHFPSLIEKYFSMTVNEFLLHNFHERCFLNFEYECLQSCSRLSHEQVQRAYNQMLFLNNVVDGLEVVEI